MQWFGCGVSPLASAPAQAFAVSEEDLLDVVLRSAVRTILTVPCTITARWHQLLSRADQCGELTLIPTVHEANLIGLAAGVWFGSGSPALVHLQNSGLGHLADGYISFASPELYAIPLAMVVTHRGATAGDDSEPHQAIGRRTQALIAAILSPGILQTGDRHGRERADEALRRILSEAQAGGQALMTLVAAALRSPSPFPSHSTKPPSPSGRHTASALHRVIDCQAKASLPLWAVERREWDRDAVILTIMDQHPDAAILFSNGYTARAARALRDRQGNFYNVGYMGGTLAIGWSLARQRPDLEVVVVDGDQNAQMSCMQEHLRQDYPENLFWYVLNNGVGASVGGARSVPLSASIRQLARVIPTTADLQMPFRHPRVRPPGAGSAAGAAPTLAMLSRRFRQWLATTSPSPGL